MNTLTTSPKEPESLQRRSLKEEIFDVLHEKIIAGKVGPGEWLRQDDIATQLGVSMTPVREALDLLVSVGLAERVPYRGVRVPQPTEEEIVEAYAMRLLLETAGARAAALKRKQAQVDELKRILSRMKGLLSLEDMSTLRHLSRQFHQSVVAIGENSTLDRLYAMVMNSFPDWLLYEYLFRHTDLLESSLSDEYQEHMALVEAIEASDADLAERMAIAHIRQLGEDLVEYLGIPYEVLESKARALSASFSPEE
ncbi:MAG: GntR family transcriptional regulator [Anaerolineales bacterium]|nr:GntR family transcriptional regulator [Anaerolineales bacterium]